MPIGSRFYWIAPAPAPAFVIFTGPFILELFSASYLGDEESPYLFLQLHNQGIIPPPAAVPIWEMLIGPQSIASYTPARMSRFLQAGLAAVLSSTPGLYTAIAGDDLICQVEGTRQIP